MAVETIRILCEDPATVNYGRAVLEVSKKGSQLRFTILYAGLVKTTIKPTEIKGDILKKLNKIAWSVSNVNARRGPFDIYTAERFMPRGSCVQFGEPISMMLALTSTTLQVRTQLVPAVSWKTQIRRYYELNDLYKMIKPCPDHLLDAVFIGLYAP